MSVLYSKHSNPYGENPGYATSSHILNLPLKNQTLRNTSSTFYYLQRFGCSTILALTLTGNLCVLYNTNFSISLVGFISIYINKISNFYNFHKYN